VEGYFGGSRARRAIHFRVWTTEGCVNQWLGNAKVFGKAIVTGQKSTNLGGWKEEGRKKLSTPDIKQGSGSSPYDTKKKDKGARKLVGTSVGRKLWV